MAGFRRDKPIDPMHEAGISRWLAEHHERRVAETEGEERADHERAARSCHERVAYWEAKAAAQSAPPARAAVVADPAPAPAIEPRPCKPTPVVSHAKPIPQPKPKPKPAQPPKVAAGQGALF